MTHYSQEPQRKDHYVFKALLILLALAVLYGVYNILNI